MSLEFEEPSPFNSTELFLKTFKYLEKNKLIMGRILGTKTTKDGKVVFEIELSYEESLQLRGHINNICVFSEDAAEIKTNLSQRGKNEATKYFLIPRELRPGLRFNEKVKCQKLETDSKIIFVYVVDKLKI